MGKKGALGANLGRSLIKDRYGRKTRPDHSMLHTSELKDGQEWGRLNLQSITEQTHVDEFLSTAELAGTEFQAVKLNVNFVRPTLLAGMPTEEDKRLTEAAQEKHKGLLQIPRRPKWNIQTTAEELAGSERSSFLEWRRSLSTLQEVDGITLTPYERNLEFWRQLWRVIERSDVVVQIVDARNPLLFRCEDLEAYVKEVDTNKDNLLLVNKSDFLTVQQRETWAQYFRDNNIKAVFFSALTGEELDDIEEQEEENKDTVDEDEDDDEDESGESEYEDALEECRQDIERLSSRLEEKCIDSDSSNQTSSHPPNITSSDLSQSGVLSMPSSSTSQPGFTPETSSTSHSEEQLSRSGYETSSQLMSRMELIDVLRRVHTGRRVEGGGVVTIGMVGYPNVGKSSTINCLMQQKKTSVSATPGKTKHFQTLYVAEDILLCDCPGLVFPAFVATKQEMIISGILPIDQMRDEVPPMNLVASRIPREVFENMYGITLAPPLEGEDPLRPPTSEELLNTYGFMRGYMTGRGLPDNPRSARYLLKDYMNGRLLYCHAPPGTPQDQYHTPTVTKIGKGGLQIKPTPQQLATQPFHVRPEVLDKKFFGAAIPQCHIKGINTGGMVRIQSEPNGGKQPRKKNFKKKEKLRRRYAHLDQ